MSRFRYFFVGAVLLHLLSLIFDSDVGCQMAVAPVLLGAGAAAGGSLLNTALAAGIPVVGSFLNSVIGNNMARSNAKYQADLQKDLMRTQWDLYSSPKAQASALADAGFNPSVVFGQGGLNTAQPNATAPAVSPVDIGLSGSDIAQSILALSQAKKAGMDTSLGEQDIKLKQIQQERDNFELDLRKKFGLQQSAADLALAQENVHLAKLSGDKTELEKAIMQYTKAKEKALSECEETRRSILEKELQNTDKRLALENRVLSTQGDANKASANASNTQAQVNRENRRLQGALADLEESGKPFKIKALIEEYKKNGSISKADAKDAELRLSRLSDVEDKRTTSYFSQVDNFLEWFKDKISIFKTK